MQLKDHVALVTGAASGIGYAIAAAFIAEGAKVLLADVETTKGEAAAAELGAAAAFIRCDVGDKASVTAAVAEAAARFGRLDCLVNNAGIIHAADFLDLEEADFDRVLRVNLKGAFLGSQAAARQMVAQNAADAAAGLPVRGGTIINLSSVNGIMAIPNQTPYNVSKGGVDQLTRNTALALAPHKIRVNGIGPGSILTDLLKVVMDSDSARDRILSRTPLGRCGEVTEIASIAVFLAGQASSYVTGQTIYADGGRMALNYTVPVQG
ncbi:dehydrogenase [Elstera litoralis]|uniref:Dehydrogenase n=1 Tax=Elstera litoralis TaxID=552518 RepID=A0A0F3IU53_9PROT|nr:SDR family oxidoreductase [Elstera litoralis]KJV10280.1 dehydrogenase [Elstera litoralis]